MQAVQTKPGKVVAKGYMHSEEPVIELPNGEYHLGKGKLECDVVGCRHCGGVIKVVLSGAHMSVNERLWNKRKETKYRCRKCNGPICRYCAESLCGREGNCFPIAAQAEFKRKHGVWPWEVGVLDWRTSVT